MFQRAIQFKGHRCRSISTRTTIRCIASNNGRPTFECWRWWKSRPYPMCRYPIPLLSDSLEL
jgi:hypothetical protein